MKVGVLCCCVALILASLHGFAQVGDGSRMVEDGGVALIKPQAWSKPGQATVFEFTGYVDRSATGNTSAGYFVLRSKTGKEHQIPSSRIVKIAIIPDVSKVTDLRSPAQRDQLVEAIAGIEETAAAYPATAPYLDQAIADLRTIVGRYDGGEVLMDGQWMKKQSFHQHQADKLAAILEPEIRTARPPGSLNLPADPRFAELMDLSADSPRARQHIDRLKEINNELAAKTRRREICDAVRNPSLSLATIRARMAELENLGPGDSATARQVLKEWAKSSEAFSLLSDKSPALAGEIDRSLQGIEEYPAPPSLSDSLRAKIQDLASPADRLDHAAAPAQLRAAASKDLAVVSFGRLLLTVPELLAENKYFELKSSLDRMTGLAPMVGESAESYTSGMKEWVDARVNEFVKLRDNGQNLLDAGKTTEAIAEWRKALELIPDPQLSGSLRELDPEGADSGKGADGG